MIHRGPGFVVVVVYLHQSYWVGVAHKVHISSLLTAGGGGGGGAKSYDGEKAWSSINNLVLSGLSFRKKTPSQIIRRREGLVLHKIIQYWSGIPEKLRECGGIFKRGRRLIKKPNSTIITFTEMEQIFSTHTYLLTVTKWKKQ
jgi:hypothetical protein